MYSCGVFIELNVFFKYRNKAYPASTDIQLERQTDSQMEKIQEHCYPPQEWYTNECHAKSKCIIIHEVTKELGETFKELKTTVTLANVSVHEKENTEQP